MKRGIPLGAGKLVGCWPSRGEATDNLTLPPDTTVQRVQCLLNRLGRVDWNVKILDRYETFDTLLRVIDLDRRKLPSQGHCQASAQPWPQRAAQSGCCEANSDLFQSWSFCVRGASRPAPTWAT